ncbi:hypothetical protein [Halorussus sp. AFM4]|uniref:hypothetical protein n=1 Tax=Halorussus sp. AFM4 TaxID=3421651 RepID=UPI003EB9888E
MECGQVYAARLSAGRVILPTDDGTCRCGATWFVNLTAGETARTPSASGDGDDRDERG